MLDVAAAAAAVNDKFAAYSGHGLRLGSVAEQCHAFLCVEVAIAQNGYFNQFVQLERSVYVFDKIIVYAVFTDMEYRI